MFAALNQAVPPEVQGGRGAPRSADQGGGGGRSGRGSGAGMLERFKAMSADEQRQFIERMKLGGQDVSALEPLVKPAEKPAPSRGGAAAKSSGPQTAETIDALFAPLPPVESRGRVWLYMNKQLKPVNVRLGITDGTNTELLSEELQPSLEVVTGVVLGGARTTSSGSGNPLIPGRGPGGFGPPAGRGR